MSSGVELTVLTVVLLQVLTRISSVPHHDVRITCDEGPVPVPCDTEYCEAFQAIADMQKIAFQVFAIMQSVTIFRMQDLVDITGIVFEQYQAPSQLSTDPNTVRFYLYSDPENSDARTELIFNDVGSIENSAYNKTRRLIMLTHGFQGDTVSDDSGCVIMKNAYLQTYASEANIVLADWSDMAGPPTSYSRPEIVILVAMFPTYAFAANNVYPAATRFTAFLKFLNDNSFLQKRGVAHAADVHLVGDNLGAHAMAMAALGFYNETSIPIFRLTGVEPAGPLFVTKPTCQRFSANLAVHVDSLHTNAGEFGILPTTEDLAKVRILVNGGGPFQPQCVPSGATVESIPFCSQKMASRIYALSLIQPIYGKCISGQACRPRKVSMGEKLSNCADGEYNVNYLSPV